MVVPNNHRFFDYNKDHFGVEIGGTTVWGFPPFELGTKKLESSFGEFYKEPSAYNLKKINMESKHGGLEDDFFLFNWVIC